MNSSEVPAGWYDDPMNPGSLRLWDGTQWTEQVQAKPTQPVPVPGAPAVPVPLPVPGAASSEERTIRYLPPPKQKNRSFLPVLLILLLVVVIFGVIAWLVTFFFIPKAPEPTVFTVGSSAPAGANQNDIPDGYLTEEEYRSNGFIQQVNTQFADVLAASSVSLSVTLEEGETTTTVLGYHEDGYGRYVSTREENSEVTSAVVIADEKNGETCVRQVTRKSPNDTATDRTANWVCGVYEASNGQDPYVAFAAENPLGILDVLKQSGETLQTVQGIEAPLSLVLNSVMQDSTVGAEMTFFFPDDKAVAYSRDIINLSNGGTVLSRTVTIVSPVDTVETLRSPELKRN